MHVLITGGSGHIGTSTTERFLASGWDVRSFGIDEGVQLEGAEYIQGDILDYENVLKAARGCDAIVHLAAIPGPLHAHGHKVFSVNAAGTFNVFEAAKVAGISRVVQASSINAIGCAYNIVDFKPAYFPIDEAHPLFTTDPYSFSKEVVEDIGAYYWRREGISSVAMRFPGVYKRDVVGTEQYIERRAADRALIDELVDEPAPMRETRIAEVRRRTLEYRAKRPLEFVPGQEPFWKDPLFEDALFRTYSMDRYNLWVNLDERDAAQSLYKGVTAQYEGAHPLFVNDRVNWLGVDTLALIRLFFPDVTDIRAGLSDAKPLVSIERARQLLGFEPEFSLDRLA